MSLVQRSTSPRKGSGVDSQRIVPGIPRSPMKKPSSKASKTISYNGSIQSNNASQQSSYAFSDVSGANEESIVRSILEEQNLLEISNDASRKTGDSSESSFSLSKAYSTFGLAVSTDSEDDSEDDSDEDSMSTDSEDDSEDDSYEEVSMQELHLGSTTSLSLPKSASIEINVVTPQISPENANQRGFSDPLPTSPSSSKQRVRSRSEVKHIMKTGANTLLAKNGNKRKKESYIDAGLDDVMNMAFGRLGNSDHSKQKDTGLDDVMNLALGRLANSDHSKQKEALSPTSAGNLDDVVNMPFSCLSSSDLSKRKESPKPTKQSKETTKATKTKHGKKHGDTKTYLEQGAELDDVVNMAFSRLSTSDHSKKKEFTKTKRPSKDDYEAGNLDDIANMAFGRLSTSDHSKMKKPLKSALKKTLPENQKLGGSVNMPSTLLSTGVHLKRKESPTSVHESIDMLARGEEGESLDITARTTTMSAIENNMNDDPMTSYYDTVDKNQLPRVNLNYRGDKYSSDYMDNADEESDSEDDMRQETNVKALYLPEMNPETSKGRQQHGIDSVGDFVSEEESGSPWAGDDGSLTLNTLDDRYGAVEGDMVNSKLVRSFLKEEQLSATIDGTRTDQTYSKMMEARVGLENHDDSYLDEGPVDVCGAVFKCTDFLSETKKSHHPMIEDVEESDGRKATTKLSAQDVFATNALVNSVEANSKPTQKDDDNSNSILSSSLQDLAVIEEAGNESKSTPLMRGNQNTASIKQEELQVDFGDDGVCCSTPFRRRSPDSIPSLKDKEGTDSSLLERNDSYWSTLSTIASTIDGKPIKHLTPVKALEEKVQILEPKELSTKDRLLHLVGWMPPERDNERPESPRSEIDDESYATSIAPKIPLTIDFLQVETMDSQLEDGKSPKEEAKKSMEKLANILSDVSSFASPLPNEPDSQNKTMDAQQNVLSLTDLTEALKDEEMILQRQLTAESNEEGACSEDHDQTKKDDEEDHQESTIVDTTPAVPDDWAEREADEIGNSRPVFRGSEQNLHHDEGNSRPPLPSSTSRRPSKFGDDDDDQALHLPNPTGDRTRVRLEPEGDTASASPSLLSQSSGAQISGVTVTGARARLGSDGDKALISPSFLSRDSQEGDDIEKANSGHLARYLEETIPNRRGNSFSDEAEAQVPLVRDDLGRLARFLEETIPTKAQETATDEALTKDLSKIGFDTSEGEIVHNLSSPNDIAMVLSDDTSNFSGLLHAVTRSSSWVAISSAESSSVFDESVEIGSNHNLNETSPSKVTEHDTSEDVRESVQEVSSASPPERFTTGSLQSSKLSSVAKERPVENITPALKDTVMDQKTTARVGRRHRSPIKKRGSQVRFLSTTPRTLDARQAPVKTKQSKSERQNVETRADDGDQASSDVSMGDILWEYDSIVQQLLHRNRKLKEKVNAEDLSTCNDSAQVKENVIDLRAQSIKKIAGRKNRMSSPPKSRRTPTPPSRRAPSPRKLELEERRKSLTVSRQRASSANHKTGQIRSPPRPGDLRKRMSPTKQRQGSTTRVASESQAQKLRFGAGEKPNPSHTKRSNSLRRSRSPVPEGPAGRLSGRRHKHSPRDRSPAPEDLSPYTTHAKSLSRQLAVARRTCHGITKSHSILFSELEEFKKKLEVHSCNKNDERALISASREILKNFKEKIQGQYEEYPKDANNAKKMEGWGNFESVRIMMMNNLNLLNEAQQAVNREQVRQQSPIKERSPEHGEQSAEEGSEELLSEIERTLEVLRQRELRNNDELKNCLEEAKNLTYTSHINSDLHNK